MTSSSSQKQVQYIMQQDRRRGHATITSLHLFYGVTHLIIVACLAAYILHFSLLFGIVSLLFGTVIPTSFNKYVVLLVPLSECMIDSWHTVQEGIHAANGSKQRMMACIN